MGKNFSTNNVTGKRRASDLYETPYSLTRLLLNEITLRGTILEPACGNGAITHVLDEYGYLYTAYDKERDFLKETQQYHTIITNPPYSLAFEFIQKANTIAREYYFLLPLAYLHGKQRYDSIYNAWAFTLRRVFIFTRYPLLGEPLREDGKHHTGMMVYAWYHFVQPIMYCDAPTIHWLDNDPYILKRHDTQ